MHDTVDLETRGIPATFVATDEFVDAAARQAGTLGLEVARTFVAHPIQDRTEEEVRLLARGVVDDLIAALVA